MKQGSLLPDGWSLTSNSYITLLRRTHVCSCFRSVLAAAAGMFGRGACCLKRSICAYGYCWSFGAAAAAPAGNVLSAGLNGSALDTNKTPLTRNPISHASSLVPPLPPFSTALRYAVRAFH